MRLEKITHCKWSKATKLLDKIANSPDKYLTKKK